MKIAILGASRTGKTWLASALAQHFQSQVRHVEDAAQLDVLIADTPPLMTALDSDSMWNDRPIDELALTHQHSYDLTLLTGLDLPWSGDSQQEQHRLQMDARLRAALQQAGIAYGVVYGSGPQRLHNALRFLSPQDTPPARWRGVCEQCSDPDCELRLFTALRNSPAAAHPAS
jgi:nicotinamide riboside kinase